METTKKTQKTKTDKCIKITLKCLKISPWDSNWDPREARIPGFPIGKEKKGKQRKTIEKQTKNETNASKVLKTSPSDIPIFPLKEPKEARIPMDPIGSLRPGCDV